MRPTPLSIKQQEFTKGLRGYDVQEVETYLENLSNEFEKILAENDKYKQELEVARIKIKEFRKIEQNLQDTLLVARESSTKAIEETKQKAEKVVKEAEEKAEAIVAKARDRERAINEAIESLKVERNKLVARLKAVVTSQASLMLESLGEKVDKPDGVEGTEKNSDIDINQIVKRLL